MTSVFDYHGQPLAVGDPVTGWYDGVRYTATVTAIARPYPGCRYRHITVLRDDNGTEHETFSDSVVVTRAPNPLSAILHFATKIRRQRS